MTGQRVAAALAAVALACGCSGSGDDTARASATTASPSASTSTTASASTTTAPGIDRPVVIAHRGASGHAPEHTFAAYDLAVEQDADYLEQDLQYTADGQLVVLHDDTLDRTTRGPTESCTGPVVEKTVAQLTGCDAGSWFNEAHPTLADPTFAELRVPTMQSVFERYGGDVRYYVELKGSAATPAAEQAFVDLLELAADGLGIGVGTGAAPADPPRLVVQSFDADSLRRLRARRPDLTLVLLVSSVGPEMTDAFLDDAATFANGIGPSSATVDASLVERAHARSLVVHPYTVDDPTEMQRLVDAGVDGMFTNVPDVARPVVDR